MTPLDVVKIRLQAQKTPFSKGNPAQGRAGGCSRPPWRAARGDVSAGRAGGRDVSALERGAIAWWQVTVGPSSSQARGPCWGSWAHAWLCPSPSAAQCRGGQHCAWQPPALQAAGLRLSLLQLLAVPPLPLFQSPCCSPWALPLPVGSVGWGWPQGTGLVTIGTAWEVAVGASSPLTHRALPRPGSEL